MRGRRWKMRLFIFGCISAGYLLGLWQGFQVWS
jgi:hypothetical protein